jgi:hypothetical protein
MTPFQILGITSNSPADVAKAAWRRLVRQHHPDMGGNEAEFRAVQGAWEEIESGYKDSPPPRATPAQSSFTSGLGKTPVYSRSRPTGPALPATHTFKHAGQNRWALHITVTLEQAHRGCSVPFTHRGSVHTYIVRPGAGDQSITIRVPSDPVIGQSFGQDETLYLHLRVE